MAFFLFGAPQRACLFHVDASRLCTSALLLGLVLTQNAGSDNLFEVILKPYASIDEERGVLVEALGHVVLERPVFLTEGNSPLGDQPRLQLCRDAQGEIARCIVHSARSLQKAYSLDPAVLAALEMQPDVAVTIMDTPVLLGEIGDPRSVEEIPWMQRASLSPDYAPTQRFSMARRAGQLRHGQHIYPRCNELCHASKSVHKGTLDIAWLMEPLWGKVLPSRVSFMDFGCREFGEGDPFFPLLQTEVSLSGLCVDASASDLAVARTHLQGHPDVKVVEAFLHPESIPEMLEGAGLLGANVDVLSIGWGDSFMADVLEAALLNAQASMIITRFAVSFPPPMLYSQHHGGEHSYVHNLTVEQSKATVGGASLSYLVQLLSKQGYLLFKMSDFRAIWVHEGLTAYFESAHADLTFPVDEWACFLQASPVYTGDGRAKFPLSYTREWLLDSDVYGALQHAWNNISGISSGSPFTLDLVRETRDVGFGGARRQRAAAGQTARSAQVQLVNNRGSHPAFSCSAFQKGSIFAHNGFHMEPGLIGESLIRNARNVAKRLELKFAKSLPLDSVYDFEVRRKTYFSEHDLQLMAPLILHPALHDLAACALGTEEVRIPILPILRMMPPGATQISWHLDFEDWRSHLSQTARVAYPTLEAVGEVLRFSESLLIVVVPLVQMVSEKSGGLMYVPGSHLRGLDLRQWSPQASKQADGSAGQQSTSFARFEEGELKIARGEHSFNQSAADETALRVGLRPGDVSAHRALVWHRGSQNSVEYTRWHVEIVYQDARAIPEKVTDPTLLPIELLVRSRDRPQDVVSTTSQLVEVVMQQQDHREEVCRDSSDVLCGAA
ncbi:unnamed protein product [Polarella glacialis]|uniref:Uncharacterized protein n=2 Tax=Polarella glacialis TaxID=89957 RepID=A0A813K166_POLGL|nr:unnamed protein product [Polarella glacialis]